VRFYLIGGLIWLLVGAAGFAGVGVAGVEKELYVLFGGLAGLRPAADSPSA
jgi:hypothetical protein